MRREAMGPAALAEAVETMRAGARRLRDQATGARAELDRCGAELLDYAAGRLEANPSLTGPMTAHAISYARAALAAS